MPTPRVHIETERLLLRDWIDADAEPFAKMNADPRVMEFFPKMRSQEESDELIAWFREGMSRDGYSQYAAEEKSSGAFIGFIGIAPIHFEAHFTPAIEIGWRLARRAWGNGYAREGARAVLAHAFGSLGLTDLVSITTEWNQPSRRVMEKIGMIRDIAGDFDHPLIAEGHKLRPHVLYRITRDEWLSQQAAG